MINHNKTTRVKRAFIVYIKQKLKIVKIKNIFQKVFKIQIYIQTEF